MNMKAKIAALGMAVAMLIPAAGCGKDKYDVYNYDLSEYVTVGNYKGIAVEDIELGISADDVDKHILLARSNYAEYARKNGAAALTDQLNIDFTGYMDGKEFEGGSAKDTDLTLGSGQFIDGFESGLVGAKAGETVTLNLKFPDPYPPSPDLAGKPVQFKVKVNYINEQILPEYNDEFVKTKYGYENTKAFEEALRLSIEEQNKETILFNRINQVWAEVLKNSEVKKYPEAEFNGRYQSYVEYYTSLAKQEGISLNEYAANAGMAVKEFEDWMKSEAEAQMKEEMVLYYIARTEKLSISKDEYQTGAMEYARNYGLTSVSELEAYFSPEEITQNLLFDKVLEYLAEQAVPAAK